LELLPTNLLSSAQLGSFADTKIIGSFINLNRSSVTSFTVPPPKGYIFPAGLSSCMTALQDQPVYIEAGGTRFNGQTGADEMSKGVFVMDAAVTTKQHTLTAAAGGEAIPSRTHAALACSPNGRLYLFGGLQLAATVEGQGDVKDSIWKPNNGLYAFKLGGSASSPSVLKEFESVTSSATQPSPRSGHAMALLSADVAAKLGMKQGALVMYGGSSIDTTNMDEFTQTLNATESSLKLRNTTWDRSMWLFDLEAKKWVQLATEGAAPPGLMYHSMEAYGQQVGCRTT
jgi:hypothetical protein